MNTNLNAIEITKSPNGQEHIYTTFNAMSIMIIHLDHTKMENSTLHFYSDQMLYSNLQDALTPVQYMFSPSFLHQHDYFELTYVLDGELHEQIEGSTFHYHKGEGCLLNRNTRHSESKQTDQTTLFLTLSREYVMNILPLIKRFSQMENLIYFFENNLVGEAKYQKDYLEFLPQSSVQSASAEMLLNLLITELSNKQPGVTQIVQGLVIRFLSCISDKKMYITNHIRLDFTAEDDLFNRIMAFLEAKNGCSSRSEIAQALKYNSDYLNRIIKKRTGMSFIALAQTFRIKEAANLLKNSDQSITNIIKLIGFENKTYFYRLFEEKLHMTPQEYRDCDSLNLETFPDMIHMGNNFK